MKKAATNTLPKISVTQTQARELLESGKIVRVTFVKKSNGTTRTLVGRSGVSKGVTGKGLKFDKKDSGIVILSDFAKIRSGTPVAKAYRCVCLDSILCFRTGGQWYTIK